MLKIQSFCLLSNTQRARLFVYLLLFFYYQTNTPFLKPQPVSYIQGLFFKCAVALIFNNVGILLCEINRTAYNCVLKDSNHLMHKNLQSTQKFNKLPHKRPDWAEPRLWFAIPAIFKQYKTVQCNIKTEYKKLQCGFNSKSMACAKSRLWWPLSVVHIIVFEGTFGKASSLALA